MMVETMVKMVIVAQIVSISEKFDQEIQAYSMEKLPAIVVPQINLANSLVPSSPRSMEIKKKSKKNSLR